MLSEYLAGALLEAGVRKSPFPLSAPAAVFLALLEEAAVRTDTGTTLGAKEAGYGGYERTEVDELAWADAAAFHITNSMEITLPVCTSGQSRILGWALCSAASAGEMLFYGEFPAAIIDLSDPAPKLPVGTLDLAFVNPTR